MTQYTIKAPIGNIVVPKEVMTEEELRDFAVQIATDSAERDIWREKAQKDPIQDVITWLAQMGFSITWE